MREEYRMSNRIKEKIGEELYNQVIAAGLKPSDFDLVTEGWIPKARFDEVNNRYKSSDDKIKTYEKQISEATGIVSVNEELKGQLESLNQKYKADLEAKDKDILDSTKKALAREKFVSMGAKGKRVDMLMRELDLNSLSVENNNLLGFDSQAEKIKTECDFCFEVKEQQSNNDPQDRSNEGTQESAFDFMKNL